MSQKVASGKGRRRKNNLWLDFIIYAVLLALLIWGGFAFRDNYYMRHLDWQTAYEGSLDDTIDAMGLIVRDETLLTASADGVLRKAVDGGTRVTAGATVAYIDAADGKSYAVKANRAGVVQFAVDGLEDTLSSGNYRQVDIAYLFSLLEKDGLQDTSIELSLGKSFRNGTVFGKIVDNLVDYRLIVYAETDHAPDTDAKKMTVQMSDGRELSGAIEEYGTVEGGQYYILRIATTSESELLSRYLRLSYTGSRVSGVIVPFAALQQSDDGSYKLFYRKKNLIAETEVELLGRKDELAVISGIAAGTDVVANPRYARVGAPAYK